MTFNSLISNNHIYRLEPYRTNNQVHIQSKVSIYYFEQLLMSAYNASYDYNTCKNCIDAFDNVCFIWYFSCDSWDTYYDFDFTKIKELINQPEYMAIFKTCLSFQKNV